MHAADFAFAALSVTAFCHPDSIAFFIENFEPNICTRQAPSILESDLPL
jgi:hypothetical protein